MANIMTGKIHMILPTETIVSKRDATKTFNKRTLVLDSTRYDPYTGERGYDNYPSFEFSGDKCAELDHFQVGQVVSVSFDLQGNKFVGSDGRERWFTSIRGYKIEARGMTQPQVQQPPQQIAQVPQVVMAQPIAQPQPITGELWQQAYPQPQVVRQPQHTVTAQSGDIDPLPF